MNMKHHFAKNCNNYVNFLFILNMYNLFMLFNIIGLFAVLTCGLEQKMSLLQVVPVIC